MGRTTVGVLGQQFDDPEIQRLERAALRKCTSLDPIVAKGAGQAESTESEPLELVEAGALFAGSGTVSGILLRFDGIEISVDKGFDVPTLSEVLNLLKGRSCSASVVQ